MLALDVRAQRLTLGLDKRRRPTGIGIGIEQYQHDSADPHWGFTSWNDFFARRFRDGRAPRRRI